MAITDQQRLRRPLFPLPLDWIQVEVSAVCNASCAYCVLSCYRGDWAGGLMDMATFERPAPAFRKAKVVFLQCWVSDQITPSVFESA